ncbi:MFS transporter [Micromonosporaceae bacterium Da 78-11]
MRNRSLLNQTFTGKARGQAYAVWGSTIGAATAVGPVLGGWLSEHASWRWAFGINVPLVAIIIGLSLAFIPVSRRTAGRVDLPGALLSFAGLAALAIGLIEGRIYGWVTSKSPFTVLGRTWDGGLSPVFVALLVAAVLLALFTWRQVRLSRDGSGGEPLMNTRLFRISSFRNGNIATLIIGLGEFGIIAVIPLWLQFTLGYTSLQAGLALLPLALGSFFASGLSFALAEKISALALVRVGLIIEAVTLAALGVVAATTSAPWWAVSLALFGYGIGVGFATAQVTNVVLADIPEEQGGQGSGIQSTFRQLGSALGIAALTTVFFSTIDNDVRSGLQADGLPTDQADRFAAAVTDSAGAVIAPFAENPATAAVARVAREAMTNGVELGSYVAAGFLVLGMLATLLIPASQPTPEPTPAESTDQLVS